MFKDWALGCSVFNRKCQDGWWWKEWCYIHRQKTQESRPKAASSDMGWSGQEGRPIFWLGHCVLNFWNVAGNPRMIKLISCIGKEACESLLMVLVLANSLGMWRNMRFMTLQSALKIDSITAKKFSFSLSSGGRLAAILMPVSLRVTAYGAGVNLVHTTKNTVWRK